MAHDPTIYSDPKRHFGAPVGSPSYQAQPVVRRMIRALRKAGYQPVGVDDGGDAIERTPTEAKMMAAIFSVDDAVAYFRSESDPKRRWIQLIADNGVDVISDWGCSTADDGPTDVFSATLDALGD